MPFKALKETDKQAFLTHLTDRGRAATAAQDAKDLQVGKGAHVVLSARTARDHHLEIRKPSNADELSKWIGLTPKMRENPTFQASLFRDSAILENMLNRTKLLELKVPEGKTLRQVIAQDQDAQYAFRMLARRYVTGILRHPIQPLPRYILEEIDSLVKEVNVLQGTWIDIVIQAGGTLQFDPPGPYSFIAHSLTVEPGGKIVTNQVNVTWDCSYVTIQ
jgi:hypothetical protein